MAAERIRIPVTEAIVKLPASDGRPKHPQYPRRTVDQISRAQRIAPHILAPWMAVSIRFKTSVRGSNPILFFGRSKASRENHLTAFHNESINIFRVLPVHLFRIDDSSNRYVYVSTVMEVSHVHRLIFCNPMSYIFY